MGNVTLKTTREEILQNLSRYVFTWEDFFHPDFIGNLSDMNPHEIFNPRLGICLSVQSSENITSINKQGYKNSYWWFEIC